MLEVTHTYFNQLHRNLRNGCGQRCTDIRVLCGSPVSSFPCKNLFCCFCDIPCFQTSKRSKLRVSRAAFLCIYLNKCLKNTSQNRDWLTAGSNVIFC